MNIIYFYSHNSAKYTKDKFRHVFSQWYMHNFTGSTDYIHSLEDALGVYQILIENKIFYCREQWMMALKALLFANHYKETNNNFRRKNIDVFNKIMNENNPRKIKSLGRKVDGFLDDLWNEWKYKIVVNGNYLQFIQSDKLKQILLNTNNLELVEASPYDKIWGIGMTEKQARQVGKNVWSRNGLNLLGKALMEVRDALREN